MPWSKKRARPKIVRKRLADGTIKVYEYERGRPAPSPRAADSLGSLIQAYQISPEWRRLSATRQDHCVRYLRRLKSLLPFPARDLTRRQIRTIRDIIAAEGTPGAANAFASIVSAMFGWAVKADWVDHNPATGIQAIPGGSFPAWTSEAATRALEVLPEHLRRLVLMALYTGQRRADLCRLAWSNYDGARIRLTQGKTGTALVIPVHPILKAAMDGWERRAATILVNARSLPWKPGSASHGMKMAIDRLGFPAGWNIHGLRKLAAANLAEAGCSAMEVAAITGHKTLAMVSLYTKSADQERMATAAIVRLQTRK